MDMAILKKGFRRMSLFHGQSADRGPARDGIRRRRAAWFFGLSLLLLAAWLGTTGLRWSSCFHPDELAIRRWMKLVRDEGYLTNRAYPNGWFQLFRVKMALDRGCRNWSRDWQRHSSQDGAVEAVAPATFFRGAADYTGMPSPTIQDGRDFNAWLYVLTALFLFAACLEAGMHPSAAFVSGVFFLASPAPLEFVHYCETDGALLVSMAFFAWLAARTLRKRSAGLAMASAFAAGFAVACKFSLVPLLLWCVAGPVALRRGGGGDPGPGGKRVALLAAGALLLAAAGYAVGTPAVWRAPAWYRGALSEASRLTYAEIVRNFGGHYSWSAACGLRWRSLLHALAERGLFPLLWGTLAWTFWWRRPFRRHLAGMPGLLPVFLPFWVFCCPFVRRQETLPLDLLFAVGAGLPLHWLLFARADRPPLRRAGRVAAAAAALLGIAALWTQGSRTWGMASCFAVRDTRAEAQNWLHDSFPRGGRLFLDSYVTQVARGVPCRASACGGLAFVWDGSPPQDGGETARYYVQNTEFEGRYAIRDPNTGSMYPEIRQRVADFEDSVDTLRRWSVSRSVPLPAFGQPRMRLLAFERPLPGTPDVPLLYDRPVRLLPDGAPLYDAGGVAFLGPRRGIHTIGKRSILRFDPANGPRWLVTRMLGGDAPVRVVREGFFSPAGAELPAGGAVAAVLAPSRAERAAPRVSAFSSMRIRMRGDDHAVFCASFLDASPAEAARTLRLAGDPAAALALLRGAAPLDAAGQVEAFLASVAARTPPDSAWTDAARLALAEADRLADARRGGGPDRTGAALCGVPLGVAADFARLRTDPLLLSPGAPLPAWLPAGRYSVTILATNSPPPDVPLRLFDGQTADFEPVAAELALAPDCTGVFSAPLELAAPRLLRLLGDPGDDTPLFAPFTADVEIAWDPVERTLETAGELRRALPASDAAAAEPTEGMHE